MQEEDLATSSLPRDAESVQIISLEIKPKCGLVDVENLPTRFVMKEKANPDPRFAQRSAYNPADFYSFDGSRFQRALMAIMDVPRNNFRCFDGRRNRQQSSEHQTSITGEKRQFLLDVLTPIFAGEGETPPLVGDLLVGLLATQSWGAGQQKTAEDVYASMTEEDRQKLDSEDSEEAAAIYDQVRHRHVG